MLTVLWMMLKKYVGHSVAQGPECFKNFPNRFDSLPVFNSRSTAVTSAARKSFLGSVLYRLSVSSVFVSLIAFYYPGLKFVLMMMSINILHSVDVFGHTTAKFYLQTPTSSARSYKIQIFHEGVPFLKSGRIHALHLLAGYIRIFFVFLYPLGIYFFYTVN